MVYHFADIEEACGNKVRGGIGEAFSRLYSGLGKREHTNIIALAVNRLGPGAAWGPHRHEDREEAFFVLEGVAEVLDNGERHRLERYDLVLVEPKQLIAIRNAGEGELVFLGLVLRVKPTWMRAFA